jgi:hypothetical protein
MLIRMKILVNYMQEYKKGMETANYLAMLSKGPGYGKEEDMSLDAEYARTLDEPVIKYLQIYDSGKRAMHLYLAGLTNLIYAENSTSSI